jgi:secernin
MGYGPVMCDALVALGEHTANGATIFAKNSDRKPGECQPFVQHPAAAHAPGCRVRCTHLEIPQVAETYRVMGHSPWWVWGFEHGVNEHAVACGNLTVFSNEPIEETPGLIGMDLVRLGLERGRTARETLEIIAGLIETHGQGGPARAPDGTGYHNAFQIADPEEAWVLETSNRRWAARRVRLGACSNHMSLGRDWEIASTDLESFARGEGWWERNGRIDVAGAYRNPHVPPHISEGRQRNATQRLAESDGALDVTRMQAILRDHGNRGAAWEPGTDPAEEAHFTVCAHSEPVHRTTASLVAELPAERERPWPVWIGFDTPCSSIFLPVYVDGLIPAELAAGGPQPGGESAWWIFHALGERVSRDGSTRTPLVRRAFEPLEIKLEADRLDAEARAMAAPNQDERARILSEFMARALAETLERTRELCDRLA